MNVTDFEHRTMRVVADRALRLHKSGRDIVFTAAIVKDGEVIATARNEVGDTNDPSRHAEVVAIARAADALGTRSLEGCTLISSCQPCEMCLSAMRWAEIDRLVFGARKETSAAAFFRFPGLSITDFHVACDRAFDYQGGLEEDRLAVIYKDAP